MDEDGGEDTQNDSEDDNHRPVKRVKKGKQDEDETSHCNINFVKNTSYPLLTGSTTKVWGITKAEDPAPKVPDARNGEYITGDYLLIKGNSIVLKHTGTNNCRATFEPEEELILTSDWEQFDQVMMGQDLVDLDDITFLLWWQNVKPPAVPKPKPATVAKKNTKKRGKRA